MASLWKREASPFWVACVTVHPAAGSPQRWKRSLKTKDLKLARKIADTVEDAGRGTLPEREIAKFCEKISDARTRRAATEIFEDVFREVFGREMGGASFRVFVESWLSRIEGEFAPQSFAKYKQVAGAFIASIGAAASRDVTSFGSHDDVLIIQFRDNLAARVAPGTVNTALKIVRQMFKAAAQRFKIESPAQHIGGIKNRDGDGARRRSFTLPEIGRVLRIAKGSEWEGMILAGFYTAGQRLADIATWRWENLDLDRREIAFTSRKTNRVIILPIADALADYIEALPSTDDPTAFVFPKAAGHVARSKSEQSGTLSNQFYDLLAKAGLVRRRTHRKAKDGPGRDARRQASEISFHSFRHTATSLLKNAGIPQSVVMDIVGHESTAVSQLYTHVGEAEKRSAIAALPSIETLLMAANAAQQPSSVKVKAAKRKERT